MIKNIKLQVKTDEQNQYVLNKLIEVNKDFAWFFALDHDDIHWSNQGSTRRDVCSRWKGFRHLVIDSDGDLFLCLYEDYYESREEKEITFDEFKQMVEPKKTLWDKRLSDKDDARIHLKDVKDALKEFMEYIEEKVYITQVTDTLNKAKEIFGEELLQ